MKQFIAIIISVLILLSALSPAMCFAASGSELKLSVISDVHFKHASILNNASAIADEDTPFYFRGGITGQADYESNAIVNSFINEYIKSDSSILLVSGDITDGHIENHREIAEKFKIIEEAGKKVFVINGNHDITSEGKDGYTSPEEFRVIYGDFGFDEALCVDSASLSYTADLGHGYRLLAVDSCIYGEDNGKIRSETLEWIKGQITDAENDNVKLIAMMHHSLLSHLSVYSLTGMQADGTEELAEILADSGVKTVFTGHFHANDISFARTFDKNEIYDIMTGSLITYPNAYRNVTISADKAEISTEYIQSVDTDDLPDCFSKKEAAAIESDFTSYSKGFLYYGIQNWINRYLGSAQKICSMLNIDRNGAIGQKLDEIMPNISNALTMKLYGETASLESTAKLAGTEIPQSNYKSLAELAGAVMCGIYCGNEAMGKNCSEVNILLIGLRAAVAYAVCSAAGQQNNTALLKKTAETVYSSAALDAYLLPMLSVITNGLTSDAYDPDDLNCSISLNGTNQNHKNNSPLGFLQKLIDIFKMLFTAFNRQMIQ